MNENEPQITQTFDFIGLMGVGKSTGVTVLSENLNLPIVPENFEDNPFLAKFFKKPKRFAFRSQLFFLNSKIAELQKFSRTSQRLGIVDTSVLQDVFSYAQAQRISGSMSDATWELYLHTFRLYESLLPPIAGVIFLTADLKKVRKRIKGRGRSYEQNVDMDYLALLDDLNKELIKKITSPVLTVDTNDMNLVDSEQDKKAFVNLVRQRFSI